MRLLIIILIFISSLFAKEIDTNDNRSISLRLHTLTWNTNWNKHIIDYNDLLSGGPTRDGIPPIDHPKFIDARSAKTWLSDNEPIIFVDVNKTIKAYPLQVLMWHEIVNDTIDNRKITVTFCPLCNASIVFDRVINKKEYTFGTSGLLRNSDLVMYDRQTESLWQQFTGKSIVGDMVETQLKEIPSSIISFKDLYTNYPNALILSKNTGYNRDYGRNPYVGYDDINQTPFMLKDKADPRLEPMRRVTAVTYKDKDIAYPLNIMKTKRVINDKLEDLNLVLFYKKGVASALNRSNIASSKDVGSVTVYNRKLGNRVLDFYYDNGFKDKQTGSTWNIFGVAINGELKGEKLENIASGSHFWFAWAVFKPNTIIYK